MRIAVVADSHFDEHSRFEECTRLHDVIAKDAAERDVEATIHTGDLYERKSTPLERQAAAKWVQTMALLGPYLQIRGNHDALEDLPLLERLLTRHPVRVVQDARVVPLGATVRVAAVGWPRKAALLAALGSQSHEDGERSAADALRSVFRGLGAELAEQGRCTRLLAMHAMVRGSVTSTGQPLVGCDLEVGLEDLALVDAQAYVLGHIHKAQQWELGGAPVIYPGSPRRTAFGETEAKGYTLLTVEGSKVEAEFIELPATPMVHISALWDGERIVTDDSPFLPGAEVRLRYTTPHDQRDAAAAGAAALRDNLAAAGAVLVKVEPIVIAEQRARAPEVATALTLEDKLEALWRAKSFEPGERREALLSKLRDLQESDYAA